MLNLCFNHASDLDIQFNTSKSLKAGNNFKAKLDNLQLDGRDIIGQDIMRYLGMYLLSGKSTVVVTACSMQVLCGSYAIHCRILQVFVSLVF